MAAGIGIGLTRGTRGGGDVISGGPSAMIDILMATMGIFIVIFTLQEIARPVELVPAAYDLLVVCDAEGEITLLNERGPVVFEGPRRQLQNEVSARLPDGGRILVALSAVCLRSDGRQTPVLDTVRAMARSLESVDESAPTYLIEVAPLGEAPDDAPGVIARWQAGGGHAMTPEGASLDDGFMDVAANMLIVLIIVTLAVLIVAAPPAPPGERVSDQVPELAVPVPRYFTLKPFSQIYIVSEAGLTALDTQALTEGLHDRPTGASTDQGRARLTVLRAGHRDLNEFSISVTLDLQNVRQTATQASTPEQVTDLVAMLDAARRDSAALPQFLVTPDGMVQFAPVYFALRKAGIPLIWTVSEGADKLTLRRRADDASTRLVSWQ